MQGTSLSPDTVDLLEDVLRLTAGLLLISLTWTLISVIFLHLLLNLLIQHRKCRLLLQASSKEERTATSFKVEVKVLDTITTEYK